jgi:hypothetical protein
MADGYLELNMSIRNTLQSASMSIKAGYIDQTDRDQGFKWTTVERILPVLILGSRLIDSIAFSKPLEHSFFIGSALGWRFATLITVQVGL